MNDRELMKLYWMLKGIVIAIVSALATYNLLMWCCS